MQKNTTKHTGEVGAVFSRSTFCDEVRDDGRWLELCTAVECLAVHHTAVCSIRSRRHRSHHQRRHASGTVEADDARVALWRCQRIEGRFRHSAVELRHAMVCWEGRRHPIVPINPVTTVSASACATISLRLVTHTFNIHITVQLVLPSVFYSLQYM